MESLNSYISDGESDSSPGPEVGRKSNSSQEEADANCEPITMDMSEDSCSSEEAKNETTEPPKRQYSKSLSPSPATSFSSRDSSPEPKKRKEDDRKEASPKVKESSKSRRRSDDDRRRKDRDCKRDDDRDYKRDDDRDRKYSSRDRSRDRHREKDSDRYHSSSKRYESKRSHKSKSRSRSRSYSRHSASNSSSSKRKAKSRSRSRSRSRDRHHYRHDSHRSSKRRSPYRSRRSRSRSHSKEKSRSYDWKSSSKMKVLEKLGIEIKVPPGGVEAAQASIAVAQATNNQLTPQLLLQKTMEEQVEKVKTATGIELPSYYNPIAVNPTKYAEQIQKRRLLWGNKDKQPVKPAEEVQVAAAKPTDVKGSGTIWQGATFGGDQDGKMTAKFQRLMGIKNVDKEGSGDASKPPTGGSDLIKKQEEMFHSMESQYEVARLATHSHRGLGLGFGTFQPR